MDLNEMWSDDPVTNQSYSMKLVQKHYVTYLPITKMWYVTSVCIEV